MLNVKDEGIKKKSISIAPKIFLGHRKNRNAIHLYVHEYSLAVPSERNGTVFCAVPLLGLSAIGQQGKIRQEVDGTNYKDKLMRTNSGSSVDSVLEQENINNATMKSEFCSYLMLTLFWFDLKWSYGDS